MSEMEWLRLATCFSLGICIHYKRPVYIEARDQIDGTRLWVLMMEHTKGWVLGKDGEWYYEPLPSSRTDEFLANTRWNSPQEVYEFWVKNITEAKQLYTTTHE